MSKTCNLHSKPALTLPWAEMIRKAIEQERSHTWIICMLLDYAEVEEQRIQEAYGAYKTEETKLEQIKMED